MIRMKRMLAIAISFSAFFLVENRCLADSEKTAPAGNYVAYESGIIRDKDSGLEWMVGPDKNTIWEEAKTWVESLNPGEGWRMPKMAEIEGLYKQGLGERNMTPLLKTSGWWVWSEDFKESSLNNIAWNFSFYFGNGRWNCPREASDRRAFAVRAVSAP